MKQCRALVLSVGVLSGLLTPPEACADEIFVAAASNLTFMMKDLVEAFEAQSPHTVQLSLGSSGNLYTQISNGAPFDVYLSADIEYAQQLAGTDLAEPGSLFAYARGRIVIWVGRQSELDVESLGLATLTQSRGRIAIANPRHAPYGRAAQAALEFYGLRTRVASRLVLGENVSQAASFVQSGAAEMGIIALSLASSDAMSDMGRFWVVPEESHPELIHGGVILSNARRRGRLEGARAFVEWMRSETTDAVLRGYGLASPNE